MNSTVIPGFQYHDAPAAIEWLCRVFGFERRAVYPGPENTTMHAELSLGGGMIMLGSTRPDGKIGCEKCGAYLVVPDADAVYGRAKTAGAEMVEEISEKPYGGRGFACRDLEGRTWHVGTYDPWAAK
jgi:uncharacterized glyoxalase superfamily protein PhnB